MRGSLLLVVIFVVLAGPALAASPLQVQGATLKNARLFSGEVVAPGAVTMPWVSSSDKTTADRINDTLFIRQLAILPPKNGDSAFFTLPTGETTSISSQNFVVTRNDGAVLAVTFESEACGAYCETSHASYLFDATTGRGLATTDIFTASGLRQLAERMDLERRSRYRAQLAIVQADLAAQQGKVPADQDALDDLRERIELNQTCLDRVGGDAGFSGYRVEFDGKGLNLSHERCSNHAERALDDVDEVTLSIAYTAKALAPLLTDYARRVLLSQGDGKPGDGVYGQVLHGSLGGRSAITMLLTLDSDGSVSGTYFYDKFRRPLDLFGKDGGGKLSLAETAPNGGSKGAFLLELKDGRLAGQWSEGAKTFDVILAP